MRYAVGWKIIQANLIECHEECNLRILLEKQEKTSLHSKFIDTVLYFSLSLSFTALQTEKHMARKTMQTNIPYLHFCSSTSQRRMFFSFYLRVFQFAIRAQRNSYYWEIIEVECTNVTALQNFSIIRPKVVKKKKNAPISTIVFCFRDFRSPHPLRN